MRAGISCSAALPSSNPLKCSGQPGPASLYQRSNSDCNSKISSAARLSSIANSDFVNYHLAGPRLLSDALGSLHHTTLFNRKVLTEPTRLEIEKGSWRQVRSIIGCNTC